MGVYFYSYTQKARKAKNKRLCLVIVRMINDFSVYLIDNEITFWSRHGIELMDYKGKI